MDDVLLAFLERLARLGEDNDARELARPKRMLNITRDTGRLLWILARATGATRVLEVGTSNAYSTIWLADAVRSNGGRVITLECDPKKVALARMNLETAGLEDVVEVIEGTAAEALASMTGPFDIVFLDADRRSYAAYLDLAVPKLRCGGLLIADNALSHAAELADYLRRVKSHPELLAVTVPVGNGEEIALRL